jgi:hypothetical protein
MVAAYFVAWSCSCIPNPVDLHATTPSPTPSTARHFRPAIAFAHLYTMNRLLGLPPRDRPHPRKAEVTAPCPEGYVPLHHLCEKCRLLVQDLKKCAFKRKWWLYEHGDTADDLIARAETCHFCAMILLDFQLNSSTNSHAPQKLTRVFIFKAAPLELYHHSIRVSTRSFGEEVQSAMISIYRSTGAEMLGPRLLSNSTAEWPRLNAQRMRTWLQTCKARHSRCTEFQKRSTDTKERPTRILRIEKGYIRLQCDVASRETFTYTALSHMWGSDRSHQLVLTLSNLLEFQSGIRYQSLPGIYMEAVRLTQALGLKHLWIDSMCIIQDFPTDWQQEASKMAAVYGNAVCNLACVSPPADFRSQLQLDPRAYIPCILGSPGHIDTAMYAVRHEVTKDWKSSDGPWTFKFDWHDPTKWPLFTRAWYVALKQLARQVLTIAAALQDVPGVPSVHTSHILRPTDAYVGMCLLAPRRVPGCAALQHRRTSDHYQSSARQITEFGGTGARALGVEWSSQFHCMEPAGVGIQIKSHYSPRGQGYCACWHRPCHTQPDEADLSGWSLARALPILPTMAARRLTAKPSTVDTRIGRARNPKLVLVLDSYNFSIKFEHVLRAVWLFASS